ncbi:MAG: ABC transporter substrate-binding protein [Dehalococcoidia bacterium]
MHQKQHGLRGGWSRRRFIQGSAVIGAGLGSAALIGCGSSNNTTPAPSGGTSAATSAATAAPGAPTAKSILGDNWINSEPNATPVSGGTITYVPGSPVLANLDPLRSTSAMVHQTVGNSYQTLMHISRSDASDRNSPVEFLPELATKWENTDPLKMVFTLREGVKFHNVAPVNGRPFTSEDVKFSIERTAGEKTSLFKGIYANMKSVEAPDPKTVVINMKSFDPLLFPSLAGHPGGWMVPKELIDGSKIRETVIGTGPFVFQEWQKDARIVFKKNPDFYIKGAPFADALDILQIGNEDTRTASLQSHQAHIADIPTRFVADFKNDKEVVSEKYLRVQPYVIFMNFKDQRFKDERVRKAISLAIDTDVMLKILAEGDGLWRGIISGQHGGWTLSQEQLKSNKYFLRHNLKEAKDLMTAAGFPDGMPSGLLFNSSYPQRYQDATQYMAETWSKNGIVQTRAYGEEHATMRKHQDEHEYDGMVFGLDGQGFPEAFLIDYRTGGPKNGSGLSDPEVDAGVNKVLSILDIKERQEAAKSFIDSTLQKVMYKIEFIDGALYEGHSVNLHNYVSPPPFQYTSPLGYAWLDKS